MSAAPATSASSPSSCESAVAAGVRRLEAMTGDAARRQLAEDSRKLREIAGLLKMPVDEAPERLAALIEDRRKLERDLAEARRKLAMGGGGAAAKTRSATSAASSSWRARSRASR